MKNQSQVSKVAEKTAIEKFKLALQERGIDIKDLLE